MTESVYVNADRTKVVSEGSADAAFRIHRKEAARLGLVKDDEEPKQAPRRTLTEPAQDRQVRRNSTKPKSELH